MVLTPRDKKISRIMAELNKGMDPYPELIEIQPSDICNQNCAYCFRKKRYHNPNKRREILSLKHYVNLFTEMEQLGITNLLISGGGEPLVSPDLKSILKSAHEHRLDTMMITNGSLLNDEVNKEILNIKKIRFSVDAINPETYSAIRGVPSSLHTQTINNIQKLIKLKEKYESPLAIHASLVLNQLNYDETKELCKYLLDIGVETVVVRHDLYGEFTVSEEDFKLLKQNLERLDSRVKVRPLENISEVRGTRCYISFFEVDIDAFGQIYSCCFGSHRGDNHEYILGNLHENSFKEIWDSSKEMRRKMITNGVNCDLCGQLSYQFNRLIDNKFQAKY